MVTGSMLIILAVGIVFLIVLLNLLARPAVSLRVSNWLLVITSISSLVIYGYGFSWIYRGQPFYALVRTLLATCGTYIGRNEYDTISVVPGYSTLAFQTVYWILQLLAIYTLFNTALTVLGRDIARSFRVRHARRGDLVLIYGSNPNALHFGRDCREKRHVSVMFVLKEADPSVVAYIDNANMAYRTDPAALHPAGGSGSHFNNFGRRRQMSASSDSPSFHSGYDLPAGEKLSSGNSFVRSLRVNSGRRVSVYCMDEDAAENYRYAEELKQGFALAGADPGRVSIAVLGEEQSGIEKILIGEEKTAENTVVGNSGAEREKKRKQAGFGSITVFDQYSLSARLLIKACPPWEEISFDADGKATEDFDVLLVGFGLYGQNILRELVRNGQFYGSHFHARVVAKDCAETAGAFREECRGMFDFYDIDFVQQDVKSLAFFEELQKNKERIKMIVLALGNGKDNREAADSIKTVLDGGRVRIPIVCCSEEGITCRRTGTMEEKTIPVFSADGMDFGTADRLAMEVNHSYVTGSGTTAAEAWRNLDYFSRMSSRASADFIPAMLRAMHIEEEDVTGESFGGTGFAGSSETSGAGAGASSGAASATGFRMASKEGTGTDAGAGTETAKETSAAAFRVSPDGSGNPKEGVLSAKQAENLGRTEHHRWCAFQFSMGYSPMSWEEWEKRASIYREQVKELKAAEGKEAGNNGSGVGSKAGSGKLIKIGKNTKDRRHICLMPWEELDELSDRENAVTGGHVDYQQIDINNVLAIPRVLRAAEEGKIH